MRLPLDLQTHHLSGFHLNPVQLKYLFGDIYADDCFAMGAVP